MTRAKTKWGGGRGDQFALVHKCKGVIADSTFDDLKATVRSMAEILGISQKLARCILARGLCTSWASIVRSKGVATPKAGYVR